MLSFVFSFTRQDYDHYTSNLLLYVIEEVVTSPLFYFLMNIHYILHAICILNVY